MSKTFLETYNSVRKKVSKPTKIINPRNEYERKFDWRKELDNDKE